MKESEAGKGDDHRSANQNFWGADYWKELEKRKALEKKEQRKCPKCGCPLWVPDIDDCGFHD